MIETIKKLVQSNPGISDFHLRAGHNFAYRESGEIIVLENTKISPSDLEALLSQSCTDKQRQEFSNNFELDCAIELEAVRLRANFYKSSDQICAVLRKIESKPPLMEDLNLPPVLHNVIDAEQGLVLITGPTGSGKTTTLASIIGEINRQRSCNIITIEDPIEFIHQDIKSRKSIAMHWGTFQLTDEPMDEPVSLLKSLVKKKEMSRSEFIVMQHGETQQIKTL